MRESTPLLAHAQDGAPTAESPTRTRRWKLAAAGAALLCAGALVGSKLRMDAAASSSAAETLERAMARQSVSMNKKNASEGENAATADFFKALEAAKNPDVDPCVDFYEYACGGWLTQHEIPADSSDVNSAFYTVGEDNKKIVRRIIESQPPVIAEFYRSCVGVGSAEVDSEAVAFVGKIVDAIRAANSTAALLSYAGELDQAYGVSSFFSVGVGADPKDPSTNVLQLSQGGLTLPSREYYIEAAKRKQYSALFAQYVSAVFSVEGLASVVSGASDAAIGQPNATTAFASIVFETERRLAEISASSAALRDPWTTNDAFTFTAIESEYPLLAAYLAGVSKHEPFPRTHAIVATPAFFAAQTAVLESLGVAQLQQYLVFHVVDSFGASLGEHFRRAFHAFHGAVRGAGSLPAREQYCVDTTTTYLGAQLGEYYMQEVFGADAQASAQELVQEIEASMKRLLKTEAWLDKVTFEAAVAKLEQVKNYIGGPRAVPELPFELRADAFFDNVLSLTQLSASETVRSIGEPVDATKWDMFPSTVNAYYDPSANKMVFPAAILQPPFYSADKYPAAANYARIGMVMGHELSHGFDDQGRNYDGTGALRKWWTASVSGDFTARAQCLSAQYSSFPVVTPDGVLLGNVNGDLTLGENIADNGGIHLAYQAYKLSQQPEGGATEADTPSPATPATDAPGGTVAVVKAKKDKGSKAEDTSATKTKTSEKKGDKNATKSKKEDDTDANDDKKSTKSKKDDKEDDKEGDKKSTKSKKDDKEDGKGDEKKSTKSKKNDDKEDGKEDDKKSTKSKKNDDKEDDKKSTKSKKDDKEDGKGDEKKSKKEDDKEDKKSSKSKKRGDDNDDDEKKHKKSNNSGDDDDDDDEGDKKHRMSKKRHDKDDDDEGRHWMSKYHHNKDGDDDDDDEGDKKHRMSKKHGDDDDKEKHKHHLRRVLAMQVLQLAKSTELSDAIKDDRLFFTAFAQNWCEKRTPAYSELLRATDPHSPGRWRVNGPLKNFDKFAAAFECKLGTPMNPEKKCLVW
ncbi:hypothetical protein PybrP1_012040 [[Pythium] brassicae (nom. inval.)]|nr:hypothetical protein PybrP1_012040 [[Pythium] brassicae (nom. inval.)]